MSTVLASNFMHNIRSILGPICKEKSKAVHAVKDGEWKIVTETDEILKAYKKFDENLLTKTDKKTKEKKN